MAMDRKPPRRRCPGNLRPPPLFLTPATVGAVLELAGVRARRTVHVPLKPVKLVDRPRRSEDPRIASANDETTDFDRPPVQESGREGMAEGGGVSAIQRVPEASPQSAPPRAKIDLSSAPSAMEQLVDSWKRR
jgi:hypothetical protein